MLPGQNNHHQFDVFPATPERWDNLEMLFGLHGAYAGCWCMFWRLPRKDFNKMKKLISISVLTLLAWILSACLLPAYDPDTGSRLIRPSEKIGKMWVNRYGHSNSDVIWDYCSSEMPSEPGLRTVECSVPETNELWIGLGVTGKDEAERDALWAARTWELTIDGNPIDLPSFNVADWDYQANGINYTARSWRIRLRGIPEGPHTLHYVVEVAPLPGENIPDVSSGTYELVVNFTFEK